MSKIVLPNIAIYYMSSIFKAPKHVCIKIESLRVSFLWEGKGPGEQGIHPITWKLVCKYKDEGGVGLTLIDAINQALLLKWLWRVDMNESAMLKNIIVYKYLGGWNGWCSEGPLDNQMSSIWRNILKLKGFYSCSFSICVGDGRKTVQGGSMAAEYRA